jgi:hypothetical protein
MECEGNGRCLSECECSYLKGTDDCRCLPYPHKHIKTKHNRFCIKVKNCHFGCSLKKCSTFNYCEYSYPEWYYELPVFTTGEQCNYCGIYDVNFTNKKDNCEICFEDKYLIETDCKHEFCLECLINMNGTEEVRYDSPCPFCRRNVEHNRLNM